jgi:hypothetical protein
MIASPSSHKRRERDEDLPLPSPKRPKIEEAYTPCYSPVSPRYYPNDEDDEEEDEKYKYEAQLPEEQQPVDVAVDSDYEIDLPVMTPPHFVVEEDVVVDVVVDDDVDEKASTVCGDEDEDEKKDMEVATERAFLDIARCVDKKNRAQITKYFSDCISDYREDEQNINHSNLLHYVEQMERIKKNNRSHLLAKKIVEIMTGYNTDADDE